ncbi:MAG: hypothetical protein ACFFG0_01380 [Candidatus Thorarchaeota archaeon]
MKKQNVIDWTDLLFHAVELGFEWNYAHEILRIFQRYDGAITIYCDEIEEMIPLQDEYIGSHFKEDTKNDGDLNQMGRDIVYDFMQKHNVTEMLVIQ